MSTIDIILDSLTPITSAANLGIDIKSQIFPDLHLNVTSLLRITKSPPNVESAIARQILKLAKPEFKVQGAGLGASKPITPWGRPTRNYFPAVCVLAILAVLLNFYAGYRVGKAA